MVVVGINIFSQLSTFKKHWSEYWPIQKHKEISVEIDVRMFYYLNKLAS